MSVKEDLKNKEDEIKELLGSRIEQLDGKISDFDEEIKPLRDERHSLQNRLNLLLGVAPTPRSTYGNNPGPVKTEVLRILEESGELMRKKEIFAKIQENGYVITENHLGTVLSNLKNTDSVIHPRAGYYGVPSAVVEDDNGDE